MGLLYSVCCRRPLNNDRSRELQYKIDEEQPKTYSWDKRTALDPRQYMFDGAKNEVLIKPPGSIAGQQFTVQNCQDCTIILLDYSASVNVDDCTNCSLLIAPSKGSVFVRDCVDCRLAVACQQFRTRDCKNIDTYLLCQTQPIIESSTNIKFGCLQLYYDQFQVHLNEAKLSAFNNNWSKVYDFTPSDSHANFNFLPQDLQMLDHLRLDGVANGGDVLASLRANSDRSLVPLTLGKRERPSKEGCFCLVFSDEQQTAGDRCRAMVKELSAMKNCYLVATVELVLTSVDVQKLTGVNNYDQSVAKGPSVAMEWCGDCIGQLSRQYLQQHSPADNSYVVIDGPELAAKLKSFYGFVEMQHGV